MTPCREITVIRRNVSLVAGSGLLDVSGVLSIFVMDYFSRGRGFLEPARFAVHVSRLYGGARGLWGNATAGAQYFGLGNLTQL